MPILSTHLPPDNNVVRVLIEEKLNSYSKRNLPRSCKQKTIKSAK